MLRLYSLPVSQRYMYERTIHRHFKHVLFISSVYPMDPYKRSRLTGFHCMVSIKCRILCALVLQLISAGNCECQWGSSKTCKTFLHSFVEASAKKDIEAACSVWNKFVDCTANCATPEEKAALLDKARHVIATVEQMCRKEGHAGGSVSRYYAKPFLIGLLMLFASLRLL